MWIKIKHLLTGYIFRVKGSGLAKFIADPNVFDVANLIGGGAYVPQHQRLVIPTMSIKDQKDFNDCVFNGTTVQKEVEEHMVLSVKSLVGYGFKNGFITGDGFAQIDAGERCLQAWGIAEGNQMNESVDMPFSQYINVDIARFTNNASAHKIKSYAVARTRDDKLRQLDMGKVLNTGLDWYSGFNQGGGFSSPWLITQNLGWMIGGHDVPMIGYDLNYQGRKVYIFQNSYGAQWGDAGKFYIDMDFFDKLGYFCYTSVDMPVDLAKFLHQYAGKNIKGPMGNPVYLVSGGKKCLYPNEAVYKSLNPYDQAIKNVVTVAQSELNALPLGPALTLK